ncbi:MAG: NAD(P)-dependent oxidoreductase [Bacteroidota bacterium]
MELLSIGLIKEGKIPIDRRVPIIPEHAAHFVGDNPKAHFVAQNSDIRAIQDSEYKEAGIPVADSVTDCDILMGVKEVPIDQLVPNKTYFFFSHTIKKQPYNRNLLRAILDKKIRLIDYELLTNEHGQRIVAFGRYAGIVGAYNGVLTYGKRYRLFDLRPAHECFDLADLTTEYSKVKLPPIKIAVTGGGRVAKGSMEVLLGMGIRQVTPAEYLEKDYEEPVFTQLNSRDYHVHQEGKPFERKEFYQYPERFESGFKSFAHATDLLIAGAFWDPKAPVLFTPQSATEPGFKIKVVADVTCDIEGSIPSTLRPSTIEDPVYDYNPESHVEKPPLSDEANITVMAVDNLPCELPRDASKDFGQELINNVLPNLFNGDPEGVIERATITQDGKLTARFQYLQDYVDDKE